MLSVKKKLVLLITFKGNCINSGYVNRKAVAIEDDIFELTNETLNNKTMAGSSCCDLEKAL
jgi:hypothetical protein